MTMFGDRARHRGRFRRLAAAVGLAVGILAGGAVFAASASAHVKVSGIDAVQGGSGVITFRVPSESATASTTGLRITFPAAAPFTSVDVQPKAGWRATVTKKPLAHPLKNDDGALITEYVASVDYTADSKAASIPPGEFDMFNLSVGPFPSAPSMSFGALQTYSDGSTVNWDEQSANGVEPAHPAPALQLAAATTAGGGAGPTVSASPSAQSQAGGGSSGGGPAWTGITGLIAGVVALVISLAVLMANRSRGKSDPSA
jgi:uncharacterized protein YcnI